MTELVTIIPWAVGGLLLLGVLVTLIFNVSGTWERIPTDTELAEIAANPYKTPPCERIVLGQFGPLVTGRRDVPGGHQEFGGFMLFRTLLISRRDHGVQALVKQGFPDPIAKLLDGEIAGKLRLGLTGGGLLLEGKFTPQKVEFTHRPPKITAKFFLDPVPRRYRRMTADELAVNEEMPAFDEGEPV